MSNALADLEYKWKVWNNREIVLEQERNRVAFLQQPLPNTDTPELSRLTKIRAVKSFFASGREIKAGQTAVVRWSVARDLVAIHRAELIGE